jgi:rhodanese-related sulfurtransferase
VIEIQRKEDREKSVEQRMQSTVTFARRYIALTLVVIGLIFSIGACSSGQPTAAAAPQAVEGAVAQAKVNTKIAPADYVAQFDADTDHILIDVRTPQEFASGHIPGAVNIAVEELAQRLNEVPQDKPVVLYCRSGNRSGQAAQILDSAGYAQIYDLGAIITWAEQGYPIQ